MRIKPQADNQLLHMVTRYQDEIVLSTLQKANGNMSEAARMLGVPRASFALYVEQASCRPQCIVSVNGASGGDAVIESLSDSFVSLRNLHNNSTELVHRDKLRQWLFEGVVSISPAVSEES